MIRACHKVFFGQASVLVQDMEKKKKEKKGALAGCARVCKIFGTVCLVAVILVCLPLTLPRVFGYEIYTVISGSMDRWEVWSMYSREHRRMPRQMM